MSRLGRYGGGVLASWSIRLFCASQRGIIQQICTHNTIYKYRCLEELKDENKKKNNLLNTCNLLSNPRLVVSKLNALLCSFPSSSKIYKKPYNHRAVSLRCPQQRGECCRFDNSYMYFGASIVWMMGTNMHGFCVFCGYMDGCVVCVVRHLCIV